jgi:hypothetical protein
MIPGFTWCFLTILAEKNGLDLIAQQGSKRSPPPSWKEPGAEPRVVIS